MAQGDKDVMTPATDIGNDAETVGQAPASSFKPAGADFAGSFAPASRPLKTSATPWYRDREYFVSGWTDPGIWKSAWIEMIATSFIVYVSGMIAGTLISYNTVQVGAYIGISSIFLIATFVYATAPASGGHLNPMVTFCVVLAGLCPVSRGVLYMIAQTLGAALGGGVLLGVWGRERATAYYGGGCFYDTAYMSQGQVFLNEFFGCLVLLYLAFGVGLDPRQAAFFGPRMGPLLVGVSLGIMTFATSGIAPGYGGAQMHPARCFGFGVAKRDFSGQWIWWFAPAAAAMLTSAMYNFIPLHFQRPQDAGQLKARPEEPQVQQV